ncbi:MAG: hypothetical protein RJQ14_18370 [Marinoscillum sp.]
MGLTLLWTVTFLLLLPYEFDILLWIVVIVLSVLGLIPFGLTIQYWIWSYGVRISIDTTNEQIEIWNHGRVEIFKFSDLTSVEICEHEMIGRIGWDFSFVKYSFANGKIGIANAFMTNAYFVPTGIAPRIYEEIVPVIWKRTNV